MASTQPFALEGSGTPAEPLSAAALPELAWTVTKMRAGAGITVDATLVAAWQAASSPHTLRALKADLEAFDLWCRRQGRIALPASPETVADYLDARAGEGGKRALDPGGAQPGSVRERRGPRRDHGCAPLEEPAHAARLQP